MLAKQTEEVEIWDCDPLVVVHGQDGVVFSGKVRAECQPSDHTGKSGRIQSLSANADGWYPILNFTQRVEMLQTFDTRVARRGGLILLGNDDQGEPFSWYINGEADRFLTSVPDTGSSDVVSLEVDRTLGATQKLRLLTIERADGYCPFSGRTEVLRVPHLTGEILEYVESSTPGEDGRLPSIYVTEESPNGDGWQWTGFDSEDYAVTWYVNEAAEALASESS